jgi:hypothetical protein
MEVTDKLSFLDLMHVVLSKDLAIPFVSFSKRNKLWILLQSSKDFSSLFCDCKEQMGS